MTIGVIGRKAGMTRVFTSSGTSIPVTVIEVATNRVAQVRTLEKDGYRALQVTAGSRKTAHLSKPELGHFAKAGIEAGDRLAEFRLDAGEGETLAVGSELGVSLFAAGQRVDVQGRTKGRGFAGVIRRYHFCSQRETHGNSLSHRAPGSIGQNQSPGRVIKGKRMAGHMGDALRTQQNLQIVRVDTDHNLLLIMGAVPGAPGGDVVVVPSTKQKNKG